MSSFVNVFLRAETDKVAKASALLFDHYDKALELLSATITNEVNNTGFGPFSLFALTRLLQEVKARYSAPIPWPLGCLLNFVCRKVASTCGRLFAP